MTALHGAGVVDADGVVARREVSGKIRQQRARKRDGRGVAVEGAGEGAQRVTRIPRTRRTGAGVLVVRLADIDRLGM